MFTAIWMYIKPYLIKIILIILVCLAVFILYKLWRSESTQNDYLKQTIREFIIKDSIQQTLILSKADFALYAQSDSAKFDQFRLLVEKHTIKTKHVKSTEIIEYWHHDTIKVIYPVRETSTGIFPIRHEDQCGGYSGYFNLVDTTYTHVSKDINLKATIINYQQRPKWFWKFRKFWKAKESQTVVESNCGTVKVERVEVR